MANSLLLSVSALAALVPASILPFRRAAPRPDMLFWILLAAALAGTAGYSAIAVGPHWNTGLSAALWVSIAVSLGLFALVSLIGREAWRLAPLLLPYLVLLGLLATVWAHAPAQQSFPPAPDAWLKIHIAISVATYGLCTLAAVAGAAALLQERALKRKRPTALTHKLPSIADANRLQVRLLAFSELVLGLGIATGMAEQYLRSGNLLAFEHKTLLALGAFALIGLLLAMHRLSGLSGQRAGRLILVAYLLLTLAYPGVKFVTDVLIA